MEDILRKILEFRDERDWKQFHTPKDLAISISLEANELLECFQWKTADEVRQFINSDEKVRLEEEVADVAIYLMLLCDAANIDLKHAIIDKLGKNNEKYPVEKSKGKHTKYSSL